MRRIGTAATRVSVALVLAGCASSGGSTATTPPASNAYSILSSHVGDVRTYAVDDGGVRRTKTITLESVRPSGADVRVGVRVVETGKPTRSMTYLRSPDGGLLVPPETSTDARGLTTRLGAYDFPALKVIESTTPTRLTVPITFSKGGQSFSAQMSVVVQGHGHRTVRVPAGRFDTILVTADLAYRVGPTSVLIDTQNYLARNLGAVEQVRVVSTNGKIAKRTVDKLTSHTRGRGARV